MNFPTVIEITETLKITHLDAELFYDEQYYAKDIKNYLECTMDEAKLVKTKVWEIAEGKAPESLTGGKKAGKELKVEDITEADFTEDAPTSAPAAPAAPAPSKKEPKAKAPKQPKAPKEPKEKKEKVDQMTLVNTPLVQGRGPSKVAVEAFEKVNGDFAEFCKELGRGQDSYSIRAFRKVLGAKQ